MIRIAALAAFAILVLTLANIGLAEILSDYIAFDLRARL